MVPLLAGGPCAFADAPSAPRVHVDLVSEVRSVPPGATFWVGVRQRIAPGWHTYWINPGDSGEPMTIDWQLPPGFSAGSLAWPHPHRLPVGPAMSFGYTDEVVLPIPITAPAGLAPGTSATLRGQASWLVCEKICIPEEAPVSLTLPVGPADPDPTGAALLAVARRAVPVPSPWPVSFATTPQTVTFTVRAPGLARERIADVWFYPMRWGAIEHAAAQTADITADEMTLRTTRGALPEAMAAPIDGVLVITEQLDNGTARQAFFVEAVPTGPETWSGPLAGPGARPRRGPGAERDALRATRPVGEGADPGPPRQCRSGRRRGARARLHAGRARLVRRARRRATRAPRRGRANRLGVPAPGPVVRHPPRVRPVRHGADALGRATRLGPARGPGPGPCGPRRLHRLLFHRRAGDSRGHAVHRALHGHGGGVRGDAALEQGAADLPGPGTRARSPVPAPQPGAEPGGGFSRGRDPGWSGSSNCSRSRCTRPWPGSCGCSVSRSGRPESRSC